MKKTARLDRIRSLTPEIDVRFQVLAGEDLESLRIQVQVPPFHPRSQQIDSYVQQCAAFAVGEEVSSLQARPLILAANVINALPWFASACEEYHGQALAIKSSEWQAKTTNYLGGLVERIRRERPAGPASVIAVGGGLTLNMGSYLAEEFATDLVLWPTTLLSMADCLGGKVRANKVVDGHLFKHFYRSFYEPNAIFIDPRFLESLPLTEIRCGLVEIIKHAVFQSEGLKAYLFTKGEALLKDPAALLRAAMWAADLKRLCVEIDVEEMEGGSRQILKAGHDFSDRLEEDEHLEISHGFAVALGIVTELTDANDEERLAETLQLLDIFGIPATLRQYRDFSISQNSIQQHPAGVTGI